MSRMGNYRVGVQETDAYQWGRDWAAQGLSILPWIEAHLGPEQTMAARLGFDDYRNEQVAQ